jgi:DNA-binding transcriptional ArsR family regulator
MGRTLGRAKESCDHESRELALSPFPVVERAASLLKAVGDPARLRLLERLARAGEQCVSELAEASGEGMSTVSQRLRLLRGEHLVARRREGKHIYYALTDTHVRELIFAALEHAAEETRNPGKETE